MLAALACAPGPSEDDGEAAPTSTSSADASDAGSGSDGSESGDAACPDVVREGGFEEGPFSDAWMEGSTLFDTVICDGSCLLGDAMAYEGEFWVWFGGMPLPESAFVSQNVPIVGGASTLRFQVRIVTNGTETFSDSLTVLLDNESLLTLDNTQRDAYAEYTAVELDVSAFADNASHLLSFDANFSGTYTSSFFVDAVELQSCPP